MKKKIEGRPLARPFSDVKERNLPWVPSRRAGQGGENVGEDLNWEGKMQCKPEIEPK